MRFVVTPFVCAVIISQLYTSVVTFSFLLSLTSSKYVTLVVCGILLDCTVGDMISLSSLFSANNDAVFIFVVFGLAPPCDVVCCLVSSSTIPSVLPCAVWWDFWLLVVTIQESLRSVSLSTGLGVDCLNCTVLWSAFLQITDLRFNKYDETGLHKPQLNLSLN